MHYLSIVGFEDRRNSIVTMNCGQLETGKGNRSRLFSDVLRPVRLTTNH